MSDEGLVLIVAGVAGSGKSRVGRLLSERLGWAFLEGDDFHSDANRARMRRGRPLRDEDRWPWLEQLRRKIDHALDRNDAAVLACSALKADYVRYLAADRPRVRVVFLRVSREEARRRLKARRGHFFPVELLESQFETLEEPEWAVDAERAPEEIVEEIVGAIRQ